MDEDEEDFYDDEEVCQDRRRSRDPSWFRKAVSKVRKAVKSGIETVKSVDPELARKILTDMTGKK